MPSIGASLPKRRRRQGRTAGASSAPGSNNVLTLTLDAANGGSVGMLTVEFSTQDGTATNGFNYLGITNTITWNNGDVVPKVIPVTLLDEVGLDVAGKSGAIMAAAFGDRLQPSATLGKVLFSQPGLPHDPRGASVGPDGLVYVLSEHAATSSPIPSEIIANAVPDSVSAIRFLGNEIAQTRPEVQGWMPPPVSQINLDSMITDTGAYRSLGNFKLDNVPPGKYSIEAIHRKAGAVTQEVEVKQENVKLDFTLELK